MKKNVLISIIAGVVACVTATLILVLPKDKPENNDFNRIVTPYSSAELDQILVTDVRKTFTVDVSENEYLRNLLETVQYYVSDYTEGDFSANQLGYVITLDSIEINVYSSSVIEFVYEDETTEFAKVSKNEFAYLSTVVAGDIMALDTYSAEQTVSVKNATNATAKNLDKEWFLDEFGDLSFVKLGNASHYDLGSWAYTVSIGSDTILFYQYYITVNGALYRLYEGSFDFFYDINFGTASGWLPWL